LLKPHAPPVPAAAAKCGAVTPKTTRYSRHDRLCEASTVRFTCRYSAGQQNEIREVGMTARRFVLALAAGLLAAFSTASSFAQDYPAHAVRIVVPFGAGGPADVAARLIGNVLQESFGQPFVIENRTGAGGVIGTVEAAKSPADGYTLLMMSNTQTANESLLTPAQRKYKLMRDLAPIAPVNYSDLVIVVNPEVAAKTLQEFIALAKAQPGKLNYASSGQGTPYHMAGELFKAMAGIDVVHVPYRNSGEARSGVIGGQVQMMIDAVPAMAPNIGENQVRALATTGKQRSAVLPNVPTAIEAGVAGYEATIWLGLMAPAGTPKAIIDKLNAAVNAMVKRPDIVKFWTEQGAVPMSMTPEEFDKFLRGDIEKWADVVKKFDKS
jgi:tripartite-type tricarboxylate transporter receptor subunit TctC